MKKKTFFVVSCCIIALFVFLFFFCRKMYYKLTEPTVISDLVCNNPYGADCQIYVKENGEYVPYYVIETKNYGDAVLLMRDDVYWKPMIYRDQNIFGTGGAYYNGSVVDDFMEKEFYLIFSDSMRKIIRNSPVPIHSFRYVRERNTSAEESVEIIYRHVFALSRTECGFGMIKKGEEGYEADKIPGVLQHPLDKYIWLRSVAFGGDDTWASVLYGSSTCSNHIQALEYIRPVFTVNADEKIEYLDMGDYYGLRRYGYIFSGDK